MNPAGRFPLGPSPLSPPGRDGPGPVDRQIGARPIVPQSGVPFREPDVRHDGLFNFPPAVPGLDAPGQPPPAPVHEPGGDLVRGALHPSVEVVDHLYRKGPQSGWFSPGVTNQNPTFFEIGSYNVNGSVRPLFARAASYVGIDVRPGPGVDLVLDVCDADLGMLPFADIVVTTETLEHAFHPALLIDAAVAMQRPGGALLLTCASAERAPHACDGGPEVPAHENYHRITLYELERWISASFHRHHRGRDVSHVFASIAHYPARGDLYVHVVKPQDA